MIELIFEIGVEDLPARFVEPALEQMESTFLELCAQQRIGVGDVRPVGTPRRLTLLVGSLAERQEDLQKEQTGPPAGIAFDDEGEPTGAARGFAGAQGVDVEDLYVLDTDKGEYVAAKVFEEGKPVRELLPTILEETVGSLRFPKSMRWADYSERFGRPVRWLLAVAGGEVVDVEFAGVESDDETRGHRFAAPEAIPVDSIDAYLDGLAEAHVVVDPDERRAQITEALDEMAAEVGGRVVEDPELVDEVVNLVEEPHPTLLDFSDEYLKLPDEVLITSMRSHQRYFAIEGAEGGGLLSHCGVIYNTPVREESTVNEGNLRVLRARLDDATFFWENDRQTTLEERLPTLDDVVWLEQVGTMYERSRRISETAGDLVLALGMNGETESHARRAGRLAKTDLVTDMVGEFSDLQGVMGREYALADGEADEVAVAIEEQYLPKGADDALPETDTGRAVALAEKLDALVGCFGVGLEPTASSDPYGLRRAALGVIRIVDDAGWTGPIRELLQITHDAYIDVEGDEEADHTGDPDELDVPRERLIDNLVEFISRRLRYLLMEHYPTDVVDAVLEVDREHVVDIFLRVEALTDLREEADFEPLALGFKRVVNILKKEEQAEAHLEGRGLSADDVDADLLEATEEQELWEAFRSSRTEVDDAVASRNWDEACVALIRLKSPVDAFFDEVMVMAEDEAVRQNRLALLAALRDLFFEVADVSKIGT